jgi:hypothetical protein
MRIDKLNAGDKIRVAGPVGDYEIEYRGNDGFKAVVFNRKSGFQYSIDPLTIICKISDGE